MLRHLGRVRKPEHSRELDLKGSIKLVSPYHPLHPRELPSWKLMSKLLESFPRQRLPLK
jgi:hypothetical protein